MTVPKTPLGIFFLIVFLFSLGLNAWIIVRRFQAPLAGTLTEIQNTSNKNAIRVVEVVSDKLLALPPPLDDRIIGLNQLSPSSLYYEVGKPVIVHADTKSSAPISGAVYRTSAWSGVGTVSPITSPNFKHVAYVDESGNIHVTNGSEERKISTEAISIPKECKSVKAAGYDIETITTSWSQLYISGWSPDSTKLLFHVHIDSPTINSLAGGFYMVDFALGKKYYISGLDQALAWFPDNQSVLSLEQENNTKKVRLFKVNLATGARTAFSGLDDTPHQVSINLNGNSMLLITGSADTSTLWEVEQGGNAKKIRELKTPEQLQSATFSPDGKSAIVIRSGSDPKNSASIFDMTTREERAIGVPVKLFKAWIDQTHALVLGGDDRGPWMLQILDVDSGTAEPLLDHASLQ